jgi:hypothetical protein
VFILPIRDSVLDPLRARFRVTAATRVRVGALAPTAAYDLPVYRVAPRPDTCP